MEAYIRGCSKVLSDKKSQKLCDGVYCSLFNELPLADYIKARQSYCAIKHKHPCSTCELMLHVASIILNEGYCLLSYAFSIVSPSVKYTPDRARSRLLQMPLVAVCVGSPSSGQSFTILMECVKGCDYAKFKLLAGGLIHSPLKQPLPDKDCVRALLQFAQSDRERECLRYAVFKTSGLSLTAFRRKYGFQNMNERSARVENAIGEAQRIHEAYDDITTIQDKALLAHFGIAEETGSSTEDTDADTDAENSASLQDQPKLTADNIELCKMVLSESSFNWFELLDVLETRYGCESAALIQEKFFSSINSFSFTEEELKLILQSKEACDAAHNDAYSSDRIARAVNGLIVTESDSDHPPDILFDKRGLEQIKKRRLAIQRRNRRLRAKAIADQRLLSRKSAAKTSKILSECTDIGKVIEDFVTECNCGADAWRRTGVLTFDGNTRLPQKVTYERIRQHLMKFYHPLHFSYGTVVQLCIARNKRRMSSKRYHGVAHVTTRRARKGFTLKYNPDSHWSAAFYKGLNVIQLKDGRDVFNLNRDDASGFRLDTLTTCSQYGTPTVEGKEIKTTRTDYVNKYPSILQVTSYNFTATKNVAEICAGVVKAPSGVHPKNPCQHAQDLNMLEGKEVLKSAFFNPETGCHKAIDAIRVDGASDEGPSHEEVQFYWTERHFLKNKLATVITTRSSGSSYKNRVELQNGCLSRGHSNTFIPSTIAGLNTDRETGAVNKEKLKENMNLAVDVYISRVNGCPCGNSIIHLFRGADSSKQQLQREKLLIFLKGTKKKKEALANNDPSLYSYFDHIWKVRKNHMVTGLPSYIFFLLCCYKDQCPHPRCQRGQPSDLSTWYPGGPPLCNLPLPVPDQKRPWGGTSCTTCSGFCAGHYITKLVDVTDHDALGQISMPPSVELNKIFINSGDAIAENDISSAAKSVLLPPEEVRIWFDHLSTVRANRSRGAQKAAQTRRRRADTQLYLRAQNGSEAQTNATCANDKNIPKKGTPIGIFMKPSAVVGSVQVRVISQEQVAAATMQTREMDVTQPPARVPVTECASTGENVQPVVEKEWWCGTCGKQYMEETDEEETWIECNVCKAWYHLSCTGLLYLPSAEELYLCVKCR